MRFARCRAAVLIGLWSAWLPDPSRAAPPLAPQEQSAGLSQLSAAFESLVERVSPAVVQVFATGYVTPPAGIARPENLLTPQRNTGSGVILDPTGYIVTNAHVAAGANRVQVVLAPRPGGLAPQKSILQSRGPLAEAELIGFDSETDLAVLKIAGERLPALELGDSDLLHSGELVLAFGSPLGLENSVTMGVVSATARQLRPEDPMIYIQTDAPINPGNSGGPLVDSAGQVVGINTLILSQSGGSEGIGFAAPSNIVRHVFDQIRKYGRVRRGEIGVYAQTITPSLARGLQLPRDWGVLLGDVLPGSPADRAGLKVGDMVLKLDGKPMENGRQLEVNLYRRSIGETVTLEVLRGDQPMSFRVAVVERADHPVDLADMVSPQENIIPQLGILGLELEIEVLERLPPLRLKEGVVVAARTAGTAFLEDGFLPGDVIHSINHIQIKSLAGLRTFLASVPPSAALAVQVERRGELRYLGLMLN
jgi:serine protease Do